jgi:hypothetical protein
MVGTAQGRLCPPYGVHGVNFKQRHLQIHADTASRSRRSFARGLTLNFPPSHNRGRRECRAPDAPAVLRAKARVARTQVVTVTPETPGIPRAMVYGLFRALPGDRALLPPSFAGPCPTTLTPASGCQDHTTLPSASSALVSRAISVHRIPRSTSVTIAKRPSVGRDNSFYSRFYRVVK